MSPFCWALPSLTLLSRLQTFRNTTIFPLCRSLNYPLAGAPSPPSVPLHSPISPRPPLRRDSILLRPLLGRPCAAPILMPCKQLLGRQGLPQRSTGRQTSEAVHGKASCWWLPDRPGAHRAKAGCAHSCLRPWPTPKSLFSAPTGDCLHGRALGRSRRGVKRRAASQLPVPGDVDDGSIGRQAVDLGHSHRLAVQQARQLLRAAQHALQARLEAGIGDGRVAQQAPASVCTCMRWWWWDGAGQVPLRTCACSLPSAHAHGVGAGLRGWWLRAHGIHVTAQRLLERWSRTAGPTTGKRGAQAANS